VDPINGRSSVLPSLTNVPVNFSQILYSAIGLLVIEGRLSYRRLRAEFHLDDAQLEALKFELVEVKRLAADQEGELLMWIGDATVNRTPRSTLTVKPASRLAESAPHAGAAPMEPGELLATSPAVEPSGGGAERRPLTVMFCDLADSTALSTRLDSEDLQDLIRAYQERCTALVREYGGFVARYLGEGILVYFGYPTALSRGRLPGARSAGRPCDDLTLEEELLTTEERGAAVVALEHELGARSPRRPRLLLREPCRHLFGVLGGALEVVEVADPVARVNSIESLLGRGDQHLRDPHHAARDRTDRVTDVRERGHHELAMQAFGDPRVVGRGGRTDRDEGPLELEREAPLRARARRLAPARERIPDQYPRHRPRALEPATVAVLQGRLDHHLTRLANELLDDRPAEPLRSVRRARPPASPERRP
jgi:class 3 adenylate cyclase